jgi:transposase
MDWTGLKLMLEGIEPKRLRKRYKKDPQTVPDSSKLTSINQSLAV